MLISLCMGNDLAKKGDYNVDKKIKTYNSNKGRLSSSHHRYFLFYSYYSSSRSSWSTTNLITERMMRSKAEDDVKSMKVYRLITYSWVSRTVTSTRTPPFADGMVPHHARSVRGVGPPPPPRPYKESTDCRPILF